MAFIKPFEAPQISVKIKIKLIFPLRQASRREGLISFTEQRYLGFSRVFLSSCISAIIPLLRIKNFLSVDL